MKHCFSSVRPSVFVFAGIFVVGAFLRLYHIGDWLHFELDQARDAKVVISAVEDGIGNLPLLGPRAGGTFLRLGPGFYYLEYMSAVLFGATPVGLVGMIAVLSIASVGIFFVLIRRLFDMSIALVLTAIVAVSPFFVFYGRFVWNPNPLPFFLMIGMYALLRSVDAKESHRGCWLVMTACFLGFATHLHFLAFVSLPTIVGIFLMIKRAKFSWKAWVLSLVSIVLMYVPVVLNEMETGWANTHEFFQAVSGKSSKSDHSLVEKIVRNVTGHMTGYWTIVTGYEEVETIWFSGSHFGNFDIACDEDCRAHYLGSGLLAFLVFAGGGALLVFSWQREDDARKKDFLSLSMVWFGTCFTLFIPLSYDLSPRFFLLETIFPLLFVGLILVFTRDVLTRVSIVRSERIRWNCVVGIGCLFVVSSMYYTGHRLNELSRAINEPITIRPDRILKEKARVTLEQQYRIVEYMIARQKENKLPIFVHSSPEYQRSFRYIMDVSGVVNDGFSSGSDVYRNGNYFLILRSVANHDENLKKYRISYDVVDKSFFGTLTVFRLIPKEAAIDKEEKTFAKEEESLIVSPRTGGFAERYTWREWWNNQSGSMDDESGNDDVENIDL